MATPQGPTQTTTTPTVMPTVGLTPAPVTSAALAQANALLASVTNADELALVLASAPAAQKPALLQAAHAKFGNAVVQQALTEAAAAAQGAEPGTSSAGPGGAGGADPTALALGVVMPAAGQASTEAPAAAEAGVPAGASSATTWTPPVDPALRDRMTRFYGQRPKRYEGLFDRSMPNEGPFVDTLPGVVAQLNEAAERAGRPYRFTVAELATNFITEGGYLLLVDTTPVQAGFSGFQYLGIDTFMQRLGELRMWISPDLTAWADNPANAEPSTNERGEAVTSLNVRDLPMGIEANAAMFAEARERFSIDGTSLGINLTTLSAEAWFFWTTVYYNTSPEFARRQLASRGVNWWRIAYTGPENNRVAKYNAAWRTSTWDYLRRLGGDDLAGLQAPTSR